MQYSGNILKMRSTLSSPVEYHLPIGEQRLDMNALLEKKLTLRYTGQINCIECGRKTKKSFNQGYCYPCFTSLAQCDSCIVKPETCHYFEGTCREPTWAESHCMTEHFVYLANSSGIKVGITRGSQIPTRWIDQGASEAIPVFRVKNRLVSGLVEMILKQHISDRTDWRKMLKGKPDTLDLSQQRDRLFEECKKEIEAIASEQGVDSIHYLANERQVHIDYPVVEYPAKVSSFNLDKDPLIEGTLQGIKGQYLIFDNGVINLRKYGGYHLEITTD